MENVAECLRDSERGTLNFPYILNRLEKIKKLTKNIKK